MIAGSAVQPVSAEGLRALLAPRLRQTADRSLLIYLHVPFCSSKCTFCDWVTEIPVTQLRSGPSVRGAYVASLCRQIRAVGPILTDLGYDAKHVYWGGGTPSKLSEEELAQVADSLAASFDLSGIGEYTMETSPDTLTAAKLATMRDIGVNRVSLGVQSFDDQELRRAARSHSSAMAEEAVHLIHDAGFANVNIDLIVGFPEQTLETLDRTLRTAIALAPRHVTTYIYRPTPGTVMARQIGTGHRNAATLPDLLQAYHFARCLLEDAGYFEYAVGYFTRDAASRFRGEEYYFNLEGDYIGFGSGGESILGHHNLKNTPAALHWYITHPTQFESVEQFSPAALETTFRALRLTMLTATGVEYRRFERLFGFPFSLIRHHPQVEALMEYYRYCGTEFEESEDRLRVSDACRRRAYIVSLERAFNPMRSQS